MAGLSDVEWPPAPIRTERLLVRPTAASDLDGYVELLCSEQLRRYLGGPLSRDDLGDLPQVPGNRPGVFAVQADDDFAGIVTLDRRDPARPGHISPAGNELEVSYTFLPVHWGHGYATEAVAGVLGWASRALPEEPVVLCTQISERSLGAAGRSPGVR
ncbi:GNAT family N-acetyltransferase [Nocardioides aurantiacus]|uniref:GNAT family N-acetyltransferase n=1 Tax=Nocardioides aurantiacus TaxID=86796 RepID=UPI001B86BBCC